MEVAFVDQGHTGDDAEADAASEGIHVEVVKLPEAKRGFVLLPRRWVVERTFGWASRFRRLAKAYERLQSVPAGMHYVAFGLLMLQKAKTHLPCISHHPLSLDPSIRDSTNEGLNSGGMWGRLAALRPPGCEAVLFAVPSRDATRAAS